MRYATSKYPEKLSYFLKQGGVSPDGRIMLKEIGSDTVTLIDQESDEMKIVKKGEVAEYKIFYAEFRKRGSDSFFVKERGTFYIPGDAAQKWKLLQVDESEVKMENSDGLEITLPVKKEA